MSPRDLYELEVAHQKARKEDAAKRIAIRADVERRWPVTSAMILHLQSQQGIR